MKRNVVLLLMLGLVMFGCEITINPSISTLKVVNETSNTIWLEIDDGATVTLSPNEYAEQSWELINSKIVSLEYWGANGSSVFTNVIVNAGVTTTFDIYETTGQLKITNETSEQVWYEIDGNTQQNLDSNLYHIWNWDLLEYEQENVNIAYSGYHVFSNSVIKNIEGGYQTEFDIEADGGCIQIWNDFVFTDIYEVYLSPRSDEFWGTNDLNGIISAGNSVFWTAQPGYWDIKLVDENGVEYVRYDNYIALDTTVMFYVDGWRKSGKSIGNKKNKTDLSFPKIADRLELK